MVPDDKIFVHKLNGVEVDDVIQFNKVLLVGTPHDTIVGRPHVQQVRVLGSIEEHVRDSTTYIYKRRRAKGYRRFRGFRAVRFLQSRLDFVGFFALCLPPSQLCAAPMLNALIEFSFTAVQLLLPTSFCAGAHSCAYTRNLGG